MNPSPPALVTVTASSGPAVKRMGALAMRGDFVQGYEAEREVILDL